MAAKRIALGSILIPYVDEQAREIAESILNELDEIATEERQGYVSFVLEDELTHFFFGAIQVLLQHENGGGWIRSMGSRMSARTGARKRAARSTKYKFIKWAKEQVNKDPKLTKNALSKRYAREHVGVSESTLRRYLTGNDLGVG